MSKSRPNRYHGHVLVSRWHLVLSHLRNRADTNWTRPSKIFLFALFTDLCLDMSKTDQVQLSIRESGLDYFQKSETIIFSTRPEMTVEQVLSLLFLEHPSQLKTSESTIRLPR